MELRKDKPGYLFIANVTKPTIEQAELRTPVPIGSFGMSSVEAAKALDIVSSTGSIASIRKILSARTILALCSTTSIATVAPLP